MTGYESKRAAAQEKLAQPAQEPVAVYGYCPECGAKSVMRERRPNGNDKCANGHTYPSNTSTPPQPAQEPVACAECERLRSALKRANGLAEHFERAWYLRGDEIEQLNAQPAQEPVAWMYQEYRDGWRDEIQFVQPPNDPIYFRNIVPVYDTPPPQRTWVEPTEGEWFKCWLILQAVDETEAEFDFADFLIIAQAVVANLKEKNT